MKKSGASSCHSSVAMVAKRKATGELSTSDMDALKEIVKSSVEDIMATKLTEFSTNVTSIIHSIVGSVINEKLEAFNQELAQKTGYSGSAACLRERSSHKQDHSTGESRGGFSAFYEGK